MDLRPWIIAADLDALRSDVALAGMLPLGVHSLGDASNLEFLPAGVWRNPSGSRNLTLELVHVDPKNAHLVSLLVSDWFRFDPSGIPSIRVSTKKYTRQDFRKLFRILKVIFAVARASSKAS